MPHSPSELSAERLSVEPLHRVRPPHAVGAGSSRGLPLDFLAYRYAVYVNARALVIGTALAIAWAGCGLSAVGLHEGPPGPTPEVDATRASLPETSAPDTTLPPVPGAGSMQIPIGDADAGDAGGADADAKLDATTDAQTALPFEVISPVGGAFHDVPAGEGLPCSTGGFDPAAMNVKNLSTEPVTLGWVNYKCIEDNYGTLGVNRQYTQPTYAGHRWRIRGTVSGMTRGDFVIDAPGTYTVIVR